MSIFSSDSLPMSFTSQPILKKPMIAEQKEIAGKVTTKPKKSKDTDGESVNKRATRASKSKKKRDVVSEKKSEKVTVLKGTAIECDPSSTDEVGPTEEITQAALRQRQDKKAGTGDYGRVKVLKGTATEYDPDTHDPDQAEQIPMRILRSRKQKKSKATPADAHDLSKTEQHHSHLEDNNQNPSGKKKQKTKESDKKIVENANKNNFSASNGLTFFSLPPPGLSEVTSIPALLLSESITELASASPTVKPARTKG
jgi:hypothetical protein